MRERTIFLLILVTLALIGAGVLAAIGLDLMPEAAADRAQAVDQLFRIMIGVATVVFLLVEGALVYAVLRFRVKEDDQSSGPPVHDNVSLELVWTLIPAIIVVVIGVYSFRVLSAIEVTAEDEMVVEVVARQFTWEFRYPEYDNLSSSQLHLVVGRPVRFEITSEDVIHSFYIPAFRAKRDATPGQISELVVTPTELGHYPIRCAELCGAAHATMLAEAVVESEADFDAWVANIASLPDDPTAAGRFVFEKYGCGACHSLEDMGTTSTVGPEMNGLGQVAGERVADLSAEEYIRQSVLNPSAHLVEGFADGLMPQDFDQRMTDAELNVLVAYLLNQ